VVLSCPANLKLKIMLFDISTEEKIALGVALLTTIRQNQEILNLGMKESLYREDTIKSLEALYNKLFKVPQLAETA
jgi:hypothetical protein